MQRHISLLLLVVFVVLAGTSCDSVDENRGETGSGTFQATVTGSLEKSLQGTADSPVAGNLLMVRLSAEEESSGNQLIVFSEIRSSENAVRSRREGTYQVRFNDLSDGEELKTEVTYEPCVPRSQSDCNGQTYLGTDGTLRVDSIEEGKVTGTFSFTATPLGETGNNTSDTNAIEVEGRFEAPFRNIEG